jgi:hypothetical protein
VALAGTGRLIPSFDQDEPDASEDRMQGCRLLARP